VKEKLDILIREKIYIKINYFKKYSGFKDKEIMEREELDVRIKELQAKAEAFFAQAGKDQIEVYRIEKFEPVRQDPQFLGKFYDGDSYVIIYKGEKAYDIHYWHGKNSSGVRSTSYFLINI
jgi:hypothetical protein